MSDSLRRWKSKLLAKAGTTLGIGSPVAVAQTPTPNASLYDSVPLPLGKSMCIRVIKIRPSYILDNSDAIVCTFKVLDVDKREFLAHEVAAKHRHFRADVRNAARNEADLPTPKIHYKALSYTWGESSANRTIKLNGAPFKVRKNLWDFLDRARRNGLHDYVWIDALCINQATIQERNHQVAMMGHVYSNAKSVIVWLGSGDGSSVSAVKHLYITLREYGIHNASRMNYDQQQESLVLGFFNQPYWSRVWIVQEFVRADSIDIWFGDLQMRSEVLAELFKFSNKTGLNVLTAATTAAKIFRWRHSANLPQNHTPKRRHQTFRRLLLQFGGNLKCSDPRDVVYALLPLLTTKEQNELDISADYSISATDLYVKILERFQNSEFDCKDTQQRVMENLASMLAADMEDRKVQLALLALRKAWYEKMITCYPLFAPIDHHCNKAEITGSKSIVTTGGCSFCSVTPKVTVRVFERPLDVIVPEWERRHGKFSEMQWKQWAKALSSSNQEDDRLLGNSIEHDLSMFSEWFH